MPKDQSLKTIAGAEELEEEIKVVGDALDQERLRARSRQHLLNHTPACDSCDGCIAKARNKGHFRGAFERDSGNYIDTFSMDQVTMADLPGTVGTGGFRYGVIICKLEEDQWRFYPLKSLAAGEALRHFEEFVRACTAR